MFGQMPRWRLFSFRGHTVYLEPIFLLLVAFFVFSGLTSAHQIGVKLLWIPTLFIGVLWHEFGHAFAMEYFGYGPSKIILQGLGGVTLNGRRGNSPPGRSVVISLAGPAFSLSLTLMFAPLAFFLPHLGLFTQLCVMMAEVNLIWAIFNLLPIAPLDGGHVVLHILRKFYPEPQALKYSAISSLVVLVLGAAALVVTHLIDPIWGVLLGFLFASHNWRVLQALRARGM